MAFAPYKAPDEVKLLKDKLDTDIIGGYLFWGEEEYLKRHYAKLLREKIIKEGMADFNLVSIEFEKGAVIDDIAEALKTPPVLAPHKMVEVSGLVFDSLKKEEEKKLVEAVKKRADDTILLFFTHLDEFDITSKKAREKKLVRELSELLFFTKFPRQEKEKLRSWTDKIFTTESLHISDVSIDKMIELCDYSMTRLRSEGDKIVCRAKFSGVVQIPQEWIPEMVRPTAENAIFDLCDAVMLQNRSEAGDIFENLAGQNFEPNVILASVSRCISGLLMMYSAINSGVSPKDAVIPSGFQAWQADKVTKALRNRTATGLARSVEKCLECDTFIKTGESRDRLLAVEKLIFTLTSEVCK